MFDSFETTMGGLFYPAARAKLIRRFWEAGGREDEQIE
jgi:hypothetical protein